MYETSTATFAFEVNYCTVCVKPGVCTDVLVIEIAPRNMWLMKQVEKIQLFGG